MALLGTFSMVLFGWQHMQLATNYSHLLAAQRPVVFCSESAGAFRSCGLKSHMLRDSMT